MQLTLKAVDQLRANPNNARTHSAKQIHQIAASIREFGFRNPILVDETGMIIAGHGRLAAAIELGLTEVPAIEVVGLSPAKKRALAIADNRIALNAGWNIEILALELQELSTLDIDFDLDITGFDTAEIDILIDGPSPKISTDPADQVVAVPADAVSRPGDLWLLGEHKLICGDARSAACFAALMGDERAGVVFTDPPFNVPIDGHVCGSGKIKHREFAMASGEMSESEFIDFLKRTLGNAAEVSRDGALHYVCMDRRHIGEIITAGKAVYTELKNLCVWNKDNGGMGSFYRSKHELVFVFKVGSGPHQNTIQLGRSGRYRCNVWDYSGVNTMRRGRLEDLGMHPTTKPVALVADALQKRLQPAR